MTRGRGFTRGFLPLAVAALLLASAFSAFSHRAASRFHARENQPVCADCLKTAVSARLLDRAAPPAVLMFAAAVFAESAENDSGRLSSAYSPVFLKVRLNS
ncbi:MAG: hypothetical protein LBU36_03540 [Clostridiales bacterium]|nr:hypothetical protein [Clostridiales bacterium]